MPAVIVVGEATSVNANIKDVVRRFATEGFIALGVDFLSPMGGTPVDPQQAQAMTIKLQAADVVAAARAASKYLKSRADVSRVGIVGFSWGGGVVNDVLVSADPSVDAAVYYYGRNPDLTKVGSIRAPVMAHYAALDNALLQQIPAYEQALTKAGKDHVIYIYPATNHGFNNDTSPARWEAVASRLAWERSVAFFREHLAG
jgi:carboxymethylenebutenolidase